MEDADVKHLISWIESAQLPYEVDESGTVSIVCDPCQLGGAVEGIEGTLTTEEENSPAGLLSPNFEATLVDKNDSADGEPDIITAPSSAKDTPQTLQVDQHLAQVNPVEEGGVVEAGKAKEYQEGECQEAIQLPTGQYFLQTPDGQIIQVLGSLGQDLEGDTTPEIQKDVHVGEEHVVGEEGEGVQILVVGGSDGRELFLISTREREREQRLPLSVASIEQSDANTEPGGPEQITVHPLPSGAWLEGMEEGEELISTHSDEHVAVHGSIPSTTEQESTTQDSMALKSELSPKSETPDKGMLVKTERGDMMAYNLSSLTQLTQSKTPGGKTVLQNIASLFGSAIKVLRPIDEKKEAKPVRICKRPLLFSCDDCGATLHSERSLESHHRRFHRAWQEECLVCGEKFLNLQCVRMHMIGKHGKDGEPYSCWRCDLESHDLKEFLRHRKCHETSRLCHHCGKKYVTPKLFREHVLTCRVRKRRKKEDLEENGEVLEPHDSLSLSGKDVENQLLKQKESDCNQTRRVGSRVSTDSSRRQTKETTESVSGGDKYDGEFQIESKYYWRQMKQLEGEIERGRRRVGRDRTHRCYLCFKLFPTPASLATHKEIYHQANSERPVRVKTDMGLDEKEDENVEPSDQKPLYLNTVNEPLKPQELFLEVKVKEEPPELLEEYENVTIIMDAQTCHMRVIKPLCIACQAHTTIDYRKQSRWFAKIADSEQSAALKKFQQFLPCALNPEMIVEPWVLCKQCATLIDKISEMEDKLVSMKHNLMARIKGESVGDQEIQGQLSNHLSFLNEQINQVGEPDRREVNGGKNLADIEAYMKKTCEIMEITRPQRRRGRPSRQPQSEKLTPVLPAVEECVSGLTQYIANGISSGELMKDMLSSSKNTKNQPILSTTVTAGDVQIKQEPAPDQADVETNKSGHIEWNDITSLAAPGDDKFDVVKAGIDSESFCADMLLKGLVTGNSETRRGVGDGSEQSVDDWTSETVNSHGDSSSKLLVVPSYSEMEGSDGENCLKDQGHVSSVNADLTLSESVLPNENETKKKVVEEVSEETGDQNHHNLTEIRKGDKIGYEQLDQPKTRLLGRSKKQARVREEREKMCYRVEPDSGGLKPWRCRECHKGFSTQRGACDHYASAHGGLSYTCQHCPASYVRKRDLIGHYNRVHLNIRPYKCKVTSCPETFSSHGELYRHLSTAHPSPNGTSPPTFPCHLCGASFAQKRYRDAHISICVSHTTNTFPYKCPMCQKGFKLHRYMQLHMRTVHCCKDEQYFCELCNKVLTDKRNLVLHMKSHLGQTKTTCQVCGKQFARKSYLWTHMRVHSNERPYSCTHCPKSFKQYSTWKSHERTHTGEKPYHCTICGANFCASSSLSKHMQYAHYKIRDYVCDICKKAFISRAKLDEHTKVHTGEKPFKCPVCDRAFNKKNNLRTHMYVHSANKKYKCELCGEGFMRRSAVETHILERHNLTSDFIISKKNKEMPGNDGITMAQFISLREKEVDEEEEEEEDEEEEEEGKEDTYIVVYAQDGVEASGEMQVTVLAEEAASNQIDVSAPLALDHQPSPDEDTIASNVLSEIVLDGAASGVPHDTLSTLISPADVTQGITIGDSGIAMGQVMEVDEVGELRLVTGTTL